MRLKERMTTTTRTLTTRILDSLTMTMRTTMTDLITAETAGTTATPKLAEALT